MLVLPLLGHKLLQVGTPSRTTDRGRGFLVNSTCVAIEERAVTVSIRGICPSHFLLDFGLDALENVNRVGGSRLACRSAVFHIKLSLVVDSLVATPGERSGNKVGRLTLGRVQMSNIVILI